MTSLCARTAPFRSSAGSKDAPVRAATSPSCLHTFAPISSAATNTSSSKRTGVADSKLVAQSFLTRGITAWFAPTTPPHHHRSTSRRTCHDHQNSDHRPEDPNRSSRPQRPPRARGRRKIHFTFLHSLLPHGRQARPRHRRRRRRRQRVLRLLRRHRRDLHRPLPSGSRRCHSDARPPN